MSFLLFGIQAFAQNVTSQSLDANNSTIEEYSGSRTERELRAAFASKGFTWLSGSPADNEKLSIGKNAQFFGFVALRYESDRLANRGALGRAFFGIVDAEQREILTKAVLAEHQPLNDWWLARAKILRLYESHLYNGEPINEKHALTLGSEFSRIGAEVAIHEARGFAELEDTLNNEQRLQLDAWRDNPELTQQLDRRNRVSAEVLNPDQYKQLEDLYAKAFSWLTGTARDNEIIPLGQPAQFFGFVSIRHKSGHGASRGNIAKSFSSILNANQLAEIDVGIARQAPVVKNFLKERHDFLAELALIRTEPEAFEYDRAMSLATKMGELEVEAGWIEAQTYQKIRTTMTDQQVALMMELRGDYVLDESQVESLTPEARGAQLAILCASCHGAAGEYRPEMVGPTLDGLFSRPIASIEGYEYSQALLNHADDAPWTIDQLDQFLAAPKRFAQGTKMEFQGLLNAEDRDAIIEYLFSTR